MRQKGHNKKVTICKPRRASKKVIPASALIWGLPASRTMRKEVSVVSATLSEVFFFFFL